MAIVVDKAKKRSDIALSCKALILEKGISNITISQIAKEAGVGKGTIYDYFTNKEDIIFEIINILLQEHNQKKKKALDSYATTKEKIKTFASFFYDEKSRDLRELYKEFISILLQSPNPDMMEFHTRCNKSYFSWFEEILKEGIKKGEIKKDALKFSRSLFATAEGLYISSVVTNDILNIKEELESYIDSLFNLIEERQ